MDNPNDFKFSPCTKAIVEKIYFEVDHSPRRNAFFTGGLAFLDRVTDIRDRARRLLRLLRGASVASLASLGGSLAAHTHQKVTH